MYSMNSLLSSNVRNSPSPTVNPFEKNRSGILSGRFGLAAAAFPAVGCPSDRDGVVSSPEQIDNLSK